MKVEIKKDLCIGCGACISIAPEILEMGDDGFATTAIEEGIRYTPEQTEKLKDAADSCPTDAIKLIEE